MYTRRYSKKEINQIKQQSTVMTAVVLILIFYIIQRIADFF